MRHVHFLTQRPQSKLLSVPLLALSNEFAAGLAQIQYLIKYIISLEPLFGLIEANPVHFTQHQSEDEGVHAWGCPGECGNGQL